MFKTIRTNRNEIIFTFLGLLLLFAGLYWGKTYFPPLAYALSFFYFAAIACVVFFSPWFIIRITMPNTVGRFVNEWWDAAWFALGKPYQFMITQDCRRIEDGDSEDHLRAGELQKQLKFTAAIYALMVLANSIIAIATFSQGISIPVLGGR